MGLREICGFVGSFSVNYPCRACKIHRKKLKKQVTEDCNLLRTVDEYETDLQIGNVTETGLVERCIWNELLYFHILTNIFFDFLHDFFEGVVQYDLSAIISHYIKCKFFTLEFLNNRIASFNFGQVDKGNSLSNLSEKK